MAEGIGADADHTVRTLRTLELLAEQPRSQTELALALGVHPRTARRLLARLVSSGYARQADKGRRYALTPAIVALAARVADQTDVVDVGLRYVVRLHTQSDGTAHLWAPRDAGVVELVRHGEERLDLLSETAPEPLPYHSTAPGKAVLAHLPSVARQLLRRGLDRRTEHTLTDPADLLLDLAKIRERGYAIDDEENELGTHGIAAAVFDDRAEPVAAVGLSGSREPRSTDRMSARAAEVVAAAAALSAALGHEGARDDALPSQVRNAADSSASQ